MGIWLKFHSEMLTDVNSPSTELTVDEVVNVAQSEDQKLQ